MKAPEQITTNLLIIGYGNPLRGDDGAGYAVAVRLAQVEYDNVRIVPAHQLTPELAYDISQTSHVVFIDAIAATSSSHAVTVKHLDNISKSETNQPQQDIATHSSAPETLLFLCRQLYDRYPKATLITIPAFNFTLGEHFSGATEKAMREAYNYMIELVNHA